MQGTEELRTSWMGWLQYVEIGTLAVVFAHPDDEAVGMGALLWQLPQAYLICVTDGSPARLTDARRAGCADRAAYAALRAAELQASVSCFGGDLRRLRCLGLGDQEASFELPRLARALARLFDQLAPALVVTHPYEGGHPDHDATAFAVQAACHVCHGRQRPAPAIAEMTSYHQSPEGLAWEEFLPGTKPVATFPLSPEDRRRKRHLLACHRSQQPVLAALPLNHERFRPAPTYDFSQPPHRGRLFYEHFDWGIDGAAWRRQAQSAWAELGCSATCAERA